MFVKQTKRYNAFCYRLRSSLSLLLLLPLLLLLLLLPMLLLLLLLPPLLLL